MLVVKGRARIFWYWIVAGIGLVALGLGILDWLLEEDIVLLMMAPILIGSGLVFVVIGIGKVRQTRPVLLVDEVGLVDCTALPHRRLRWSEIVDFRLIGTVGRGPIWLAVDVNDPAKLIRKALIGSSTMMTAFEKVCGTPWVITLKLLDIEPRDLLGRLKAARKQFKR